MEQVYVYRLPPCEREWFQFVPLLVYSQSSYKSELYFNAILLITHRSNSLLNFVIPCPGWLLTNKENNRKSRINLKI